MITPRLDAEEPAIARALDQSERVRETVEQAAADLSSVNGVLKNEIADGVPLAKVELALNQSEAIEVHIQQAAEEMGAINDALAEEIDERRDLERRLSRSDAALAESRAEARKSRHSALHDGITGLPNLELFNDRLGNALAQAERHTRRLAVMFIDLNEFKNINDTHGHDTGDRVLQMVAERLQEGIRAGDTVSRRSGDEFLFLMLEIKDESNAGELAARIVDKIAAPADIDGVSFTVRSSLGIAVYPEDGRSVQELLKNADAAMYVAKQQKQGSAFYSRIPPAPRVG